MDKDQLTKLSEMDPEFAQFMKQNPIPKANWADLENFRAMRAQLEKQRLEKQGPLPAGLTETSQTIRMRDGFESRIKIHRPDSPGGPLIVLVFGGGFVVGNVDQLTPLARILAKVYGAVTVAISYRLSPEHKFPVAAHDAEDSLIWISKHAESLGADPSKGFVLGGISAGGNLTATIAQKTLDDKSLAQPLTGIWLCVPLVFFAGRDQVPTEYRDLHISGDQNANAPGLDKDAVDTVRGYVEPQLDSPLACPFNSPNAHKNLPPVCIQVSGLDPLRDDGLIYERVLRENGVQTKLDIWPGVPHAHFSFYPFLEVSKKALLDIGLGFGWLLKSDKTAEELQRLLVSAITVT